MQKFLEVSYLPSFFCHWVCSSNVRTGQITVCSNLKIQISEDDDDDDEEFMHLPYPAYYKATGSCKSGGSLCV
jgi:hypothetical protein